MDKGEFKSIKACVPATVFRNSCLKSQRCEANHTQDISRAAISKFTALNILDQLKIWQAIWLDVFGQALDVKNIRVPDRTDGFAWPVAVPDLPLSSVMAFAKNAFGIQVPRIFRDMDDDLVTIYELEEPRVVWLRPRIEADYELDNKSARDLKRSQIRAITIVERILLEFLIDKITSGEGQLDVKGWTLCAGSISRKTRTVPCIYYHSISGLEITGCLPTDRYGIMRARQVKE